MKSFSEFLRGFVLSIYQFSALTGQNFLSSATDEPDSMVGRKISCGAKEADWFLAKNCGSDSRQTPSGSNLKKSGFVVSACNPLLLLAEAAATRNNVLYVKSSRGVLCRGSYGGSASVLRTSLMDHEGASLFWGGRLLKNPFKTCAISWLLLNVEPSGKPLWMTLTAER